jgi:P-type Cu+ transporter
VTSASAAAGRPPAASARAGLLTDRPWRRLALAAVALVASYALALGTRSLGTIGAAVLATLLLLGGVVLVRASAGVAGPRPIPRWYGPVTLLAAAVVLVVRGGVDDWAGGAAAAVAVLLATAPGALLAAAELPLAQARRRGLADGIDLRHAAALPLARGVAVLAVDGVGPLVDGMVVEGVHPLDETHLRNLRWFAGALAHALETPLGRAVAKLSGRGNLTDIVDHPGLGISGSVDRHPTRLGSPAWTGLTDVESPWESVGIEVDGRPLGTVVVADALRQDTVVSVASLRDQGVEVALVAPAADARAAAVAERAGIAVLLPRAAEEDAVLSALAPAARLLLGPAGDRIGLAQAEIGAAAHALRLSRAADCAQRRGVRVALVWHAVCLVLAAAGLLAVWAAAIAALLGTLVACLVARASH